MTLRLLLIYIKTLPFCAQGLRCASGVSWCVETNLSRAAPSPLSHGYLAVLAEFCSVVPAMLGLCWPWRGSASPALAACRDHRVPLWAQWLRGTTPTPILSPSFLHTPMSTFIICISRAGIWGAGESETEELNPSGDFRASAGKSPQAWSNQMQLRPI